jgi:Raf kinase inhibitor-like YbhB/YbcL family protein
MSRQTVGWWPSWAAISTIESRPSAISSEANAGTVQAVSRAWGAAMVLLILALAACGGDGGSVKGSAPAAPDTLRLSSAAFAAGATIPRRYTCDGANEAPPLRWTRPPKATRELALLVEDPDAPGGTFVHWTVYGLPAAATHLTRATEAKQGENSFGKRGYNGPCPPKGDKPHRYVFTLYALKVRTTLKAGAKPARVRAAIAKRAVARGRLIGRFGRG